MAAVASTTGFLSTVLQAGCAEDLTYFTARVLVKTLSGTKSINPLGVALIWDNTISAFRELNAADVTPTQISTLPDGGGVAVAVGDGTGAGNTLNNVTLSTTGVTLDVVFRGTDDIKIVNDGINFSGTATNTEKTLFRVLLERAGIKVIDKNPAVVHTYL